LNRTLNALFSNVLLSDPRLKFTVGVASVRDEASNAVFALAL
jgi:hypothetical protein